MSENIEFVYFLDGIQVDREFIDFNRKDITLKVVEEKVIVTTKVENGE